MSMYHTHCCHSFTMLKNTQKQPVSLKSGQMKKVMKEKSNSSTSGIYNQNVGRRQRLALYRTSRKLIVFDSITL